MFKILFFSREVVQKLRFLNNSILHKHFILSIILKHNFLLNSGDRVVIRTGIARGNPRGLFFSRRAAAKAFAAAG
jgi:hypothetical protein